MTFTNESEAITYVFESLARTNWRARGLDEHTRDIRPTRQLLALLDLPDRGLEYAVITGSKGKGSVAAITAKLLTSLGHTTGLITSPHLTTYRERFRVNGRMISEADLVRLINTLRPAIDRVRARLSENQYLSPQGIFLALGLRWFAERGVRAAVIEVGRGGRFDDNALVPNMLSMFTPIMLEHTRYLGDTVERIAWHKSGIIKPESYAYSLPQQPGVMQVLRSEAETQNAVFEWLAARDTGVYLGPAEAPALGQRVALGRYGEITLPMLGRYEIANASLAVWGAGNMHGRLRHPDDLSHGSEAYVQRIRAGLESVTWPGRVQRLQTAPAVYVDGAINVVSARSYIDSLRDRWTRPLVSVLAVPQDRDYPAVYELFAAVSDTLILTETGRNITIHFPEPAEALRAARVHHEDVHHAETVAAAVDLARARAGVDGTVLLSLAQPAVGDVMAYYDLRYEQI